MGPQLCAVESRAGVTPFVVTKAELHPYFMFVAFLYDETRACASTCANYLSQVRGRLRVHFTTPVPESPLAELTLTRLAQIPRTRRYADPIPAELIAALSFNEHLDLGLRTAVLVMWSLALRVAAVSSQKVAEYDSSYCVTRADVTIGEDGHARVWVPCTKTDRHNAGASYVILRTDGAACPVRLLQRYIAATADRAASEPFFQWVNRRSLITRQHIADAIRDTGVALGMDPQFLLPHGVRSGAATAAVTAGLSMADLLLLGRWASEQSALVYLRQNATRATRIAAALSLDAHFDAEGTLAPVVTPVFLLGTRQRAGTVCA